MSSTHSSGITRYILGIPEHSEHWLTHVETLCAQGHGWLAATTTKPVTIPLHRWHRETETTGFGHQKKSYVPRQHNIHWYIIGTAHMDIHAYIASLSSLTKHSRGVWYMPPTHMHRTHGRALEKTIFLNMWCALAQERIDIVKYHMGRKAMAANMAATKALIPWSPFSWLRRIYSKSTAWDVGYTHKSTIIYVMVTALSKKVYVGQTGGKRNLRCMMQRYHEHRRKGSTWRMHKHKHARNKETGLYDAMATMGWEQFVMLPIAITTPMHANHLEDIWIQQFGKQVWNLTDSKWLTRGPWKALYTPTPRVTTEPHTSYNIQAQNLLQLPSRSFKLIDLMRVCISGHGRMPKDTHNTLGMRLREIAREKHGYRLPARLPIPHPPASLNSLTHLKRVIADLLRNLSIPPIVREYMRRVTMFVSVRGCKVQNMLCTKGTSLPWHELQRLETAPCRCSAAAPHLHRINGCVVERTIKGIRTLAPQYVDVLAQNMTDAVLGDPEMYITKAQRALTPLHRALPDTPPDWISITRYQIKTIVSDMYAETLTSAAPSLH